MSFKGPHVAFEKKHRTVPPDLEHTQAQTHASKRTSTFYRFCVIQTSLQSQLIKQQHTL